MSTTLFRKHVKWCTPLEHCVEPAVPSQHSEDITMYGANCLRIRISDAIERVQKRVLRVIYPEA